MKGKSGGALEQKIINLFGVIFNMPANMGIIVLTALTWLFLLVFSIDEALIVNIVHYIILTSIASIIIGKLGKTNNNLQVINLGVIGLLLGVFAIISSKVVILSSIGYLVICPVSFFVFFLMLRALWESDEANKA